MERLTAIVAMDENGVIGSSNTLPWKMKSDMAFFKETTLNNAVIMGRKTFDSMGGRCLPKRRNYILTHSLSLLPVSHKECVSVNSIPEVLYKSANRPKRIKDVFVIGGASVYEQFNDFVDRYIVTIIRKSVEGGDAFFDCEPLFNKEKWASKTLLEGQAKPGVDEADFIVTEFVSLNARRYSAQREQAISQYESKLSKNSPGSQSSKRAKLSPDFQHTPAFI
ncbi:MAG: dihydrofolate reductase [Pseudomonadota bacterium]